MAYSDYDIDSPQKFTRFPSLKVGKLSGTDVTDYGAGDEGPSDGQFAFQDAQTIAMADAAVTLTVRRASSATQITSNVLFVDAQSAGASENLLLPPEADCDGYALFIVNEGGEAVVVQNDAGTAISTLPAGEAGIFVCDGTSWKGMMGYTSASTGSVVVTEGVSFTEDGSGTSYTATVEIPAGAVVHDIGFTTTVLWDGTSASLDIGDDDDPNGWFAAVNLKATDLLVGEVLSAADDGTWGGKNGVYLTAAGRRGRVTAGVDSGWYYGAASEVIFLVTPGAADGSAGRSFGWVRYSVPTFVASTNV